MSRQQHTSSDERLLLISLFKERASILQSKKAEGKKALPKAKAWEDITSVLNAAALGPPRSVKQTKKLWENMKSRAKKLYGIEGNRTDGSVHSQHYDVISAKVFDIISKDLNRNIKTKDVNSDPTCGTDGNGETSAADKNSTKGTSATENSSDGSVHLKPKENPSSVLESLYEDLAFADVTLTAQGQSVRAHRAVLSAKSLYFKEVLQSSPYQHPIIIMPLDVQFSDLQAIISYIYKGEITLPSENLQSLLKTANALQISDLARADVLDRTANGRDEAPCKTVELHSDRVNSRSSICISEHNAAEGTHNQPTLPVIARKDVLHSDRAEGPFLSSRRKRPRAEAFSEAEPTTSVRTQSKSPRLAESNSCSETPVKVEDFEEHGHGQEDYTSTDYMHCDKSLLQPEQSLGRHSETTDSIFIKEEPID